MTDSAAPIQPDSPSAPLPLAGPQAGVPQVAVAKAPAPPEAPVLGPHLSRQIREGVERTTELRLDPPELGRVRFVVTGSEQGVQLVIQADRAETADLLRRHLDLLGQDLRQAGYARVEVSVGSGGDPPPRAPLPPLPPDEGAPSLSDTTVITLAAPAARAGGGLDLRL